MDWPSELQRTGAQGIQLPLLVYGPVYFIQEKDEESKPYEEDG
jgi:hypothetical protein